MWLLLVLGWACSVAARADGEEYYALLPELRTSEGTWDSPFTPQQFEYTVWLSAGTAAVSVEAIVDFARYAGPEAYPLISIDGRERHYGSNDLIADVVEINTSSLGSWKHDVAVVVQQPPEVAGALPPAKTTYLLHLERGADVEHLLTPQRLALEDDAGRAVDLAPAFNASDVVRRYQASLAPAVQRVRVTFACDSLAETEINGEVVSDGQPTWVPVEKQQASTVVTAVCVYGSDRRTLQVSLFEIADLSSLAAKLEIMVLGSEGRVERISNTSFIVYAFTPTVELVPIYRDARIVLRLAVPNASEIALGPGMPTPPLAVPETGRRTVQLVLVSHEDFLNIQVVLTRSSPFEPGETPSTRRSLLSPFMLGSAMAALVGGCVVVSTAIVSTLAALGRGGPLESSASLRSLALLMQFVALTNVVEGPGAMADFAQALRWLCLLPGRLPWEAVGVSAQPLAGVADAEVCLTGCLALFAAVIAVHLVVRSVRLLGGCRRAVPHSLLFGTWEVRCLVHISYPASCAGTLLLLTLLPPDQSGSGWLGPGICWRTAAAAALVAPLLAGLVAAWCVRRALRQRLVAWISEESGARDAHGLEELRQGRLGNPERGRYCDATCDQICTLPEERSCCPGLSLCWAGTVAAVRPQPLAPLLAAAARGRLTEGAACSLLGPEGEEEDDDSSGSSGEAKCSRHLLVPRHGRCRTVVEVMQTSPSCSSRCCGRLALAEVGLYAGVDWLEAMVGVEEVIRLHRQAQSPAARRKVPATPLCVEISQLQGPLTCGRLGFCFDGMRWPHFPPLELAFRGALGVLSATALAHPGWRAAALAGASCLSGGLFAVAFVEAPCTSFGENAALLLAQLGLALAAFAYLGHAGGAFAPEVCGGVVMLCSVGAMVPALLFVVMRTMALCCAAFGVARGYEQDRQAHHGCNVDLSLRWPKDVEAMLVPARCQVPVVECTVHAQQTSEVSADVYVEEKRRPDSGRPRLDFPVLDYIALVDRLEPPRAVLLGPSQTQVGWNPLGYRAEAVYADEDPAPIVAAFVEHSVGIDFAHDVVPEVLGAVAEHGQRGCILVLELIAPLLPEATSPGATAAAFQSCMEGDRSSDGSSEGESEMLLASGQHG